MKIAIPSTGENLEANVDPRFGRCSYFLIVETDENKIKGHESIKNTGVRAMGGAGITAAQLVANKGVNTVITGNIGPNAFNVLSQTGIKIITGVTNSTVKEAVQKFLKGELKETDMPSRGFGRGMGKGRRQ
jgi:predicted Fe-Mo cluster-binding NifX family protein